jgi:cell division protein FtsL
MINIFSLNKKTDGLIKIIKKQSAEKTTLKNEIAELKSKKYRKIP